jgi:hypothetical protein
MVVEFYTKPRCSLCEEGKAALVEALAGEQFELRELDITRSPFWFERYRYAIPVVVVDGEEIARLRFDAKTLREKLGR